MLALTTQKSEGIRPIFHHVESTTEPRSTEPASRQRHVGGVVLHQENPHIRMGGVGAHEPSQGDADQARKLVRTHQLAM